MFNKEDMLCLANIQLHKSLQHNNITNTHTKPKLNKLACNLGKQADLFWSNISYALFRKQATVKDEHNITKEEQHQLLIIYCCSLEQAALFLLIPKQVNTTLCCHDGSKSSIQSVL